jgi:hypothetical protein
MILDTIAAFEVLEHYDIRSARTDYVDSAEAAIAFAQRRDARDPREIPIVLRAASTKPLDREAFAAEHPLESAAAIRRAYERIVREAGTARVIAQAATEPGTDLIISGMIDPELGRKTIALQSAAHSVRRMIPLGSDGAEILASGFQGYRGSRERAHRMLAHLLEKISAFFEETPVTRFHLRVRLHENGYTVLDAMMESPEALHLRRRLDSRAHDRKGDEYRPAGRQ